MRNYKLYNTLFSIFILSIILLCILLGIWQIFRGKEKAHILQEAKKNNIADAIDYIPAKNLPKPYSFLKIKGSYLPIVFLLDNQHYAHAFGYNIILALKTNYNNILFVDAGFIQGDISRSKFPQYKIPHGMQNIRGQVYYPKIASWSLGAFAETISTKKIIIENLNLAKLSRITQNIRQKDKNIKKSIYTNTLPFILRLYPVKKDNLIHVWPLVTISAARHYAYALQWFGIAIAILCAFIYYQKQSDLYEKK